MTLRDLYLRISAVVDHLPAVKAEVDAAFADHEAAANAPAADPVPAAGDAQEEGA